MPGKRAQQVVAGMLVALLAACATPQDDGERFIDMPDRWKSIDLAEADLTLPLDSPLRINRLRKRSGEGQVFENLYTFDGAKGYVLTSRVVFAYYSDRTARNLRSGGDFNSFALDLSLPSGGKLDVKTAQPYFDSQGRHSGYYGAATSQSLSGGCFVARVGLKLVDYASIPHAPDSFDTIVVVLLCGERPDDELLLSLFAKLKAVEDREAFRQAMSKRKVGTI